MHSNERSAAVVDRQRRIRAHEVVAEPICTAAELADRIPFLLDLIEHNLTFEEVA